LPRHKNFNTLICWDTLLDTSKAAIQPEIVSELPEPTLQVKTKVLIQSPVILALTKGVDKMLEWGTEYV